MSWTPELNRALTFKRLKTFLIENDLITSEELKKTVTSSLCLKRSFFSSTNFLYISDGETRGIRVHQYTVPADGSAGSYDNDLIVVEPDILYIIPPEPVSYTVLLRAGLGVNGNSSSSYVEISSTQVSEGGTWEFPSNITANNNYKLRNIVYTDCEGVTLTINASDGVFSSLPTLTINCDLTIDINADRYYKVKIITLSGTKYNNASTGESGIEVTLKKGTTWTSEAFSVDDPNNDLVVTRKSGTSSKYSYDSSTNKVKITKIASDYVIESSTQAVTPTDELSIIKLVQEECFGVTPPVLGLDFEIHEGNQDISSLLTLSTDNTLDLLGEYRIVVILDEEETSYHIHSYYQILLYWNNEIVYLGSELDTCIVPYYNSPTFVKTAWQYDDIASNSNITQVNVSSPFIGLPEDGLATITVSVNGNSTYPCYLAGITVFDGEWVTAPTQSRNYVIAVPQNHNGKAIKNTGAITESVTTPDLMTISIMTISPHTCQINLTNISSSINLYIWASSTLRWPESPCSINTIEVRRRGGAGTQVLLVIERGDADFPDWLTLDQQDRGSNNDLSSFAYLYLEDLALSEIAALNLMTTLLNSIPALNDLLFFYWYIESSCNSGVEDWECDNCTLFLDFELDTPVPTIIYVYAKVKLASVNDCNEVVDWSNITTTNLIVGTLSNSSLIIFNNVDFNNVCSADLYDSQGTLLLTHVGYWSTSDLATYLIDHTFEPGGHILANYEFRVRLLPASSSCTYYDPETIRLHNSNAIIISGNNEIQIGSFSTPGVNHFEIQECTESNGSSTCGNYVDIFNNGTGINNNAITVTPLAYSGGATATITFSDIKADCSGLGSSKTKEFSVSL